MDIYRRGIILKIKKKEKALYSFAQNYQLILNSIGLNKNSTDNLRKLLCLVCDSLVFL
jgi:hypothetical protein